MTTIQIKAIRPPKIRPDLYKLEILKELDRQGQIMKRMLQKTTRTWRSPKPVFRVESVVREGPISAGGGARVRVWTSDERWNWVDQGTRRHRIAPRRRGGRLRFRVGGKPKTRPKRLGSGRGRPGTQWVTAKVVHHPGIKARQFSKEVFLRRWRWFYKQMNAAHERGLRRAQRGR